MSKALSPRSAPGAAAADPSKSKWAVWIPITIAAFGSAGGAIGWGWSQYEARKAAAAHRIEEITAKDDKLLLTLSAIDAKLEEARQRYEQVRSDYGQDTEGLLERYAVFARQDGALKHELLYSYLSDLVGINAAIVALLDNYTGSALTGGIQFEANEFRSHARAYSIRFNHLPSVIATDAMLPSAKAFPAGLPSAVQEEIAAVKHHKSQSTAAATFERKFSMIMRTQHRVDGYLKEQWCDDSKVALAKTYPTAIFIVQASSDHSRRPAFTHNVEYELSCTFGITMTDKL